ncbi:DUF4192 domain-containing protein [Antribacter gilvus]|uniref:DUF4192 domain-containing protein n=1 Tax=Antribacter gilvus TaxID=2304675 RepID=UPI000F7842B1|nr:DUF4192 domain-containing protein [Antribacter gilvus]
MTTATVRVGGPQDLLAYIPFRLGFRPQDSLVVVSLRGPRRSVGLVARVDLDDLTLAPPVGAGPAGAGPAGTGGAGTDGPGEPGGGGEPGGAGLADWLVEHTVADGADRAVVVVYTAADLDGRPRGAERRAVDLVRARLDRVLPGTEAWVVAPTGYRALGCTDQVCCPPGGRPLTQIEGSRVSAGMVLEGRTVAPSRAERYAIRPAATEARAQASRAAGRWQQQHDRIVVAAAGTGPDAARAVRSLSQRGAEVLDLWRTLTRQAAVEPGQQVVLAPVLLGRLAAGLSDTWIRDAVLLSLVPGTEELASATARRQADPARDAAIGSVMARIVDPGVGEQPDRRLTAPACVVLEAVVAHVPRRRWAPACLLLGLLSWWDGDGGGAGERVTEALRAEPGYRLAVLLGSALQGGVPPGWVGRVYREEEESRGREAAPRPSLGARAG